MTSENYRQLLNNEFEAKEMTKEDFDNTLMHFAMLYHKEQLKLYGVISCKNQDEALKRLKLLRKVKNNYESKDLMVTKKYMIKQIKKHLTNAFWHGWNL